MIGDQIRDKDSVSAVALICEMAAYEKNKGRSLFAKLVDLYVQYGFYKENLISITKKGMNGASEIAKMMEEGKTNLEKGEKFLAENAKKPGVVTTPSGLQYQVLTAGKGAKPSPTDGVKVNYKGTLLDGKEFDSSYKRGEPAVLPLNGVIPGWSEGLQLMQVGGKYKFWIPAKLAYGEQAPPMIGPNQLLEFEVELLDIVKPPAGK